MTMFASHAPGEVIDAIRPDLEAFTSLWTALRVNYEGTNITRTVARLLHMYQPEEGVVAYERLLRTLFVLLDDFDKDGLQLLVSMVPPPKGVSDEVVKEVFNNATGFVRVDAPIFHKNTGAAPSTLNIPYARPASRSYSSNSIQQTDSVGTLEKLSAPESTNNLSGAVQNHTVQNTRLQGSPQVISQESSEVFRGFPPSEIINTQSHVQNIKNFYRPSTSYAFPPPGPRFVNFGQIVGQNSGQIQQPLAAGLIRPTYRQKWFQNPYIMQKSSYPISQYQDYYLKTVNNQYVKVPAAKVHNFHQASINTSRVSYQTLYNNAHDYLRNRSNTVTSGLLEKIQLHCGFQEAAIKKIITDCKLAKNAVAFHNPQVSDNENDLTNAEFKGSDAIKVTSESPVDLVPEITGLQKTNIGITSKAASAVMKTNNASHCMQSEAMTGRTNQCSLEHRHGKLDLDQDVNEENATANQEFFEQFAKEVRMRQRAIQEDIYKMDVVHCEVVREAAVKQEFEACESVKTDILMVSDELRNSCKRFMDRAKVEKCIQAPNFPKTRALTDIHKHPIVLQPSDSNLRRLLTFNNVSYKRTLKNDHDREVPEFQNSAQEIAEVRPPTEVTITKELAPSALVHKRIVRRKRNDIPSVRPKSQKVAQKSPTSQNLLENDLVNNIKPQLNTRMMNNSSESVSRCPSSNPLQTASSSISPATTMAELAAYKKQYYDALLSIQKAKAAVANSLAISSAGNPSRFNPYYYNYLQQQHHQMLQRQQHQMLIGNRFSQNQSIPSGAPWFRPTDWRCPVISQSRVAQRSQMIHPPSSLWSPGVGFLGRGSQTAAPQQQQLNIAQQPKHPVKRRKLEEIVGKLKESDNSGTN